MESEFLDKKEVQEEVDLRFGKDCLCVLARHRGKDE